VNIFGIFPSGIVISDLCKQNIFSLQTIKNRINAPSLKKLNVIRQIQKYLDKRTITHMDANKLQFFRRLLQGNIAEMLNAQVKMTADTTNINERITDPADQASLETDRNCELQIRDRERQLIAKMQGAIKRIDNGTYGICVDCDEEISEKRLIASPITTQCIDCKTKQEKIEKLVKKWESPVMRCSFQE
jgi:DnaK suppressor protein